ncbi:MAG: SDR family NAD(P)-dependent oxidoreductase [Bryobacteraceae bacterium]
MDFTGKNAVVTGGANGIGLAIARVLAGRGARVTVFDLAGEDPSGAVAPFGATGMAVDVTDRAALDRAFAATGAPDVLMVNAGVVDRAPFDETSRESWDRTLAVNLTGAFLTIQCAAAHMKPRRRGAIVVTASTNSFDGEALYTAYNATKAGLLGLVHTIANELGPYQVRVNAVCPGFIRTRLNEEAFREPESVKEYFRGLPLGRHGTPEEVAHAAAFLACDLASYITGATLLVDGGQMASKYSTWSEDTADFVDCRWRLRD